MNYIVLDMEWNQPVNPKMLVRKPVVLYGEIVQIGAVKLDEKLRIIDTFKVLISPEHYTEMNKMVSELTKITTEQLQLGIAFTFAFEKFRMWCGEDFVFFTWGSNDIDILRDNMRLYSLDTQWIPDSYNIQLIFAEQILKENRPVSLSKAMEKIDVEALEAHDALNDAINTVCICQHLDMNKGIAEYQTLTTKKKKRKKKKSRQEKKETCVTYPSKRASLNDKKITEFLCPYCNGNVRCRDFVSQNTNKYIALCKCDNGDELFVRVRISQCDNGKFSAARLIYEANDENKALYSKKKLKEKKVEKYYKPYYYKTKK